MNPYSILGVEPGASDDEIKRAYRRASSSAHPDREGGSTERQQEVNEAYAILSDPAKRSEFDATGKVSTDDLRSQAMEMAIACFLQQIDNVWVADPIKEAVSHLEGECIKAKDEASQLTKRIAKLRKVASRIKAKQGEDVLSTALDRAVAGMDRGIDAAEKFQARARLAIEILQNHELQPEHAGQSSMRIDYNFFNQGL